MGIPLPPCGVGTDGSTLVVDSDPSAVGIAVVGATGDSVEELVGTNDGTADVLNILGLHVLIIVLGSVLGTSLHCGTSCPSSSGVAFTKGRGGLSAICFLGFVSSTLGMELGSSLGSSLGEELSLGGALKLLPVVGGKVGAAVVGDTEGMTLGCQVGESVATSLGTALG